MGYGDEAIVDFDHLLDWILLASYGYGLQDLAVLK